MPAARKRATLGNDNATIDRGWLVEALTRIAYARCRWWRDPFDTLEVEDDHDAKKVKHGVPPSVGVDTDNRFKVIGAFAQHFVAHGVLRFMNASGFVVALVHSVRERRLGFALPRLD